MPKPLWRRRRKLWQGHFAMQWPFNFVGSHQCQSRCGVEGVNSGQRSPIQLNTSHTGHTITYHQRQVLGATEERVPAIDGPRLAGTRRRGERFGATYIRPDDLWQA
jgi:hypothetical protein